MFFWIISLASSGEIFLNLTCFTLPANPSPVRKTISTNTNMNMKNYGKTILYARTAGEKYRSMISTITMDYANTAEG